ncbi:survival of motor neuron-related-splicing factor 30 [Dermatophagoides pteronyssinus]|uniref:Survival of motor neuron--splicing factor 30 n=2 Tax=Dermatophagoides pteronyssinus TaxID=6956 RepID=A0ABQ8JHG5_DERPT|nr:survival of motor neuron-related-splicing factor 30-like [Dermatophagoides pteronyssinus]KAH9422048.1 Survival of motor neuron--splicing factor 30 [Dermatophagoides pteronyssinus]
MSDNLANIRNYKIQLRQVEMSLINEPDNDDLKTLQHDLNEVIQLTIQMMTKEELAALESLESDGAPTNEHHFSAGDWVLAPWSEDGQFYEAQVEDITSDGQCTVMFNHTKKRISEVCLVGLLKPLGKKRGTFNNNHKAHISSLGSTNKAGLGSASHYLSGDNSTSSSSSSQQQATNINQFKKQQELREHQRRKQQKRKEKLKQLEEEREKDKMKWQSFAHKVVNKKMKGNQKKSIFASPDSVSGRVGVGTCGVGGRPMTEYQQQKLENVPRKASSNLPKLSLSTPY